MIRIWVNYYEITDWNVYRFYLMHLAGKLTDEQMINRANNPLESWNAVFNRFFMHSPVMTAFIAVIRNCSQEKYNDLVRIQLGQNNRKIRKPPSFPVMSADYASFVPVPVVAVPAMLAAPAVVAMAAPVMVAAPAVIAMPVPAVPARALIGPIVAAGAMAAPAVIAMPAPAVPARALIAPAMIAPIVAAGAMAAPAVIKNWDYLSK